MSAQSQRCSHSDTPHTPALVLTCTCVYLHDFTYFHVHKLCQIAFTYTYIPLMWTCSPTYTSGRDRKLIFAHAFSLSKEILSFKAEEKESEPRVLSCFLPSPTTLRDKDQFYTEKRKKEGGRRGLVWISPGMKWSVLLPPWISVSTSVKWG